MGSQTVHATVGVIRVVMAGPLPPLVGGMATVIDDISRSNLSSSTDLVLFNTAKQTPQDRSLWQGVRAKVSLWNKWSSVVGQRKNTIVHIHTCSGLSFFLDGVLLLIARMRKHPVILHIHGARFDQFLDNMPKPLLFVARWLAAKAARLVVLSEEWRTKLSQRLQTGNITVIHNGVPVPEIPAKEKNKEEVTVLFLGNLSTRKGVWDLLKAMVEVPNPIRLVMAGGEDEQGAGVKLKSEIDKLGLQAQVTWLGPVVGEEKKQLLFSADIFVLPSYAEGLPMALLEAMCSGLPVIVTPVGGIPTVVSHGTQGLLVNAGDIDGLHAALIQLATDEDLRLKCGQEARRTCSQEFGIDKVADRYLTLYKELMYN